LIEITEKIKLYKIYKDVLVKQFGLSVMCWLLSGFVYANNLSENLITRTIQQHLEDEKLGCSANVSDCRSELEVLVQSLDELSLHKKAIVRDAVKNYAKKTFIEISQQKNLVGEALQLYVVYRQSGGAKDLQWETDLQLRMATKGLIRQTQVKAYHTMAAHPEIFSNFVSLQKDYNPDRKVDNSDIAQDLLDSEPEIEKYRSGAYKNKPRLYVFCRHHRDYPCLMVMKNADGRLHLNNDNQTIWSQPALGLSRHGKKYNQQNGNTPSGVYRIDGVMPEADQRMVFGSFRRLILNFVSKTENEVDQKYLLPASSHENLWWHEATTARDIGRGLFRIHGTGLRSSDTRPYFPLVATSGCVAKRENTYNSVKYKDQRELLDEMMLAQGLEPKFENEARLRGLLYVINLDDNKRPVTLPELISRGIVK